MGPWFQSLKFLAAKCKEDELPFRAAALSYYSLLSFVPIFAMVVAVFQISEGLKSNFLELVQPFILNHLAPEAVGQVVKEIEGVLQRTHSLKMGWVGLISLGFVTVSLFRRIEVVFNDFFSVKDNRPWIRQAPLFLGFLLGFAVFFLISFFTQNWLKQYLPIPGWLDWFSFAMITGFFSGLYYFVPAKKVRKSAAFMGALISSGLWLLCKIGFAHYLKLAVSYNLIYGTLASLPLFLVWVYLSWTVFLLGAEVSSVFTLKKKSK